MAEIGGQEPWPLLNFIALHRNLIFKPGGWRTPGFLKLFLSGKSVCVCVGVFAHR